MPKKVDRLALRRELTRLHEDLRRALGENEQAARKALALDDALAGAEALRIALAAATERDANRALLETKRAAEQATVLRDVLTDSAACVLAEQAAARAQAAIVRADETGAALATVLGSRTWRATAPMRALLGITKRAARKIT